MPTFSSSVNKPGSKRVAPKAPTRRAQRTALPPNVRSESRDTPSYSQSVHGTPERAGLDNAQVNQAVIDGVVAAPIEAQDDGTLRSLQAERSPPPRVEGGPSNASNTQPMPQGVPDPTVPPGASVEDNTRVEPSKTTPGKRGGRKPTKKATAVQKTSDGPAVENGEGSSIASSLRSRRQKPTSTNKQTAEPNGDTVGEVLANGTTEPSAAKPTRKRAPKRPAESQDQPTTKKRKKSKTAASKATNGAQSNAPAKKRAPPKKQVRRRALSAEVEAEQDNEASAEDLEEDEIEPEQSTRTTRRRRRQDPVQEGQNHQIQPSQVRLGDLTKDDGLGISSVREAEMEKIDWVDVRKKRRVEEQERYDEDQRAKEARKQGNALPKAGPHATERLVLVNGQIVVDEASRVIDRNAATAREAENHDDDPITEDRLTKRVNQRTIGRKPSSIIRNATWNAEETELFYQGLRMFGTDFMMISKLFPGTARSTIKKKYTKEERINADRVSHALINREAVDLDDFAKLTDTVFQDPKEFYEELEVEKIRLEAEDAKARADAEAEDAEVDVEVDADAEDQDQDEEREEAEEQDDEGEEVHPSIEQENAIEAPPSTAATTEPEATGGKRTKKTLAVESGKAAEKKGGARKKQGKLAGKKDGKGGAKGGLPAEGTEEMIGSIAEFEP